MIGNVRITAIFELVKHVLNIYLAKEGLLADYISLIFGLINLSQIIAFWRCYNKNLRRIFYLWHRISSCFWMRRESSVVKLLNTLNMLRAASQSNVYAHCGTSLISKTQSIHNQSPHMPEKFDRLASIDRIMIELQNFSFELQRMFPQPKFQNKSENTKIMELIFTLTQWLRNSLCFLICNGDRDRQRNGYFRIC